MRVILSQDLNIKKINLLNDFDITNEQTSLLIGEVKTNLKEKRNLASFCTKWNFICLNKFNNSFAFFFIFKFAKKLSEEIFHEMLFWILAWLFNASEAEEKLNNKMIFKLFNTNTCLIHACTYVLYLNQKWLNICSRSFGISLLLLNVVKNILYTSRNDFTSALRQMKKRRCTSVGRFSCKVHYHDNGKSLTLLQSCWTVSQTQKCLQI